MPQPDSSTASNPFVQARNGLILNQALYVAASLRIPDLVEEGLHTAAELARKSEVNEGALYRILRLLASQGIFEETAARTFKNTATSSLLRTGVPGSLRSQSVFWGSDFFYAPFGEILYTVQTGEPARTKLHGMNGFEYLRDNPETARIFDDAMTANSERVGPGIAAAYDFGSWGSLMDVGGGNGSLLSHILRQHDQLRGVLADEPQVLERARQRGFLSGALETRTTMEPCNFFREIPSGCRAYVMKSVIHDWDDDQARTILRNCRKAVPADGVLLLVELPLSEDDLPSAGKFVDLAMMVLTGGRERTEVEYRELLASGGFRLNKVVQTSNEYAVIEALPV